MLQANASFFPNLIIFRATYISMPFEIHSLIGSFQINRQVSVKPLKAFDA